MATKELNMGIINISKDDTPVNNEETVEMNEESIKVDSELAVDNEAKEGGDKQAKVVLDGPLSKIYTKALNLVYANEASGMIGPYIHELFNDDSKDFPENGSSKDDEGNDESTYMYCCDGSNMTSDELVKGSDKLRIALDSKKYNRVILAVEHNGKVNAKMGLLERFASDIGSTVCLSRESAVEALRLAIWRCV